jgi:hypothetical protein
MRRLVLGVALAGLLLAGCADILGLDPLGPVVRTGDDEDDHLPDAAAEASTPSDAADQ